MCRGEPRDWVCNQCRFWGKERSSGQALIVVPKSWILTRLSLAVSQLAQRDAICTFVPLRGLSRNTKAREVEKGRLRIKYRQKSPTLRTSKSEARASQK